MGTPPPHCFCAVAVLEAAPELSYSVVFREDKWGLERDTNKRIFHYELGGGVSWRRVNASHGSCLLDGDGSVLVTRFACAAAADGRRKFRHGHIPGRALSRDVRSLCRGRAAADELLPQPKPRVTMAGPAKPSLPCPWAFSF